MVLGCKTRYQRIVSTNRNERLEPCTGARPHLLCRHELSCEGLVGLWADHEPEPGGLGLLRRSLRTVFAAIVFELVEVCGPVLALQRNRRARPEMRALGHGQDVRVLPRRARSPRPLRKHPRSRPLPT